MIGLGVESGGMSDTTLMGASTKSGGGKSSEIASRLIN